MKQQAVSLRVAGLMTDPGPFTATPDGGMVEAQNVVILRPGVVEPRPGTQWYKDALLKTNDDKASAIYSDPSGNIFVWASTPWIVRQNGSTTITGPSSFISGKIRTAPTGGRALFTSENGVCTLPGQLASPASGSATVAYRAGMPQPYTPRVYLTAAAGISASATDTVLAYRFTLRRRLANGTIVESAPSSPVPVRSLAAWALGNQDVQIGDPLYPYRGWRTSGYPGFGDLIAGDELCVYRSARITPGDAIPPDEMRLRTVITYDVATGTFPAFTDKLPDASWSGQELYTNETEEGAQLGNYRPQYARDVAAYKGMTFYAGAKSAQRVSLNLKRVGQGATAASPSETLTTWAFSSGDILVGTNTILTIAAADIAYMSVGQVVTRDTNVPGTADAYFPANTYITAVGATSVTVSANALATQLNAALKAWDWVQTTLSGVDTRMYVVQALATTPARAFYPYDLDIPYIVGGPPSMENAWNGTTATSSGYPDIQLRVSGGRPFTYAAGVISSYEDMLVVFEGTDPAAGSFVVKSSKPLAWDRYVDSVTGVTSAQSGGIAELQWSKINEPEHCPLPYRTVIGDESSAIRRVIVANQSLLIFKDDGLYQWFGETPADYRIELVDRTITIPAAKDLSAGDEPAKWIGRFDDRVYAMTTRGPMAIADTGGTPVGAPILESLRRRFVYAYGANDEARRALMIDPQSRRVGFFYDIAGTDTYSVAYVLDVDTGTWTYWVYPRPVADFGVFGSLGAPVFAGGYSYGLIIEDRTMLDDASVTAATLPTTNERWPNETCTINTVTGSGPYTITIAAGSEWTPVVGDLLIRSGVSHQVSAITSATVFTTDTQPTTGAATWREGFEARCVWTARAEGNVGTEKTWASVAMPFELAGLTARMKSYVNGYRNTDGASESFIDATSQGIGTSPFSLLPTFKRWHVRRDRSSDWALRIGFSIRQACCWFSTSGLSVMYDAAAPDLVGGRR